MNTISTTNEEEIQVVRTASCPSLSARSTITYEIGSKGENQYIRLSGNSAGGLFCKEWVPLSEIQQLLAGSPNLTSKTLQPLYAGKSSNSPGFLLACVINENLAEKDRSPADHDPESPSQKKPAKAKKDTAKEIPT